MPNAVDGAVLGREGERSAGLQSDLEALAADTIGQGTGSAEDAELVDRGRGPAEGLQWFNDAHAPLSQDDDGVADGLHVGKDVGRDEDRFPFLRRKDAHAAQHGFALLGIEAGGRLIEDEQGGVVDDGLSKLELLRACRWSSFRRGDSVLPPGAEIEHLVGSAERSTEGIPESRAAKRTISTPLSPAM